MAETMAEKIEKANLRHKETMDKARREHPEWFKKVDAVTFGAEPPEISPEEGLSGPVDPLSQMGKEAAEKFEEAGRPMKGAKDD
jgi:hypothetical protein